MLKHRAIGQRSRLAQHALLFLGRFFRPEGAFDLSCEHLAGELACNIARLGTAHAVADHGQKRTARELFDSVVILILLADIAGVRQSPCLHLSTPFRQVHTFFSAARTKR